MRLTQLSRNTLKEDMLVPKQLSLSLIVIF